MFDCLFDDRTRGSCDRVTVDPGQPRQASARANTAQEQYLVHINISESGDDVLIHQHVFDGATRVSPERGKIVSSKAREVERLGPQVRK